MPKSLTAGITLAFRVALVFSLALCLADGPMAGADDSATRKEDPGVVSPTAGAIAAVLQANTAPGQANLEAIRPLYQKALSIAPRDARLEFAFSLVLQRMFQPTEAREHLGRALELDPEFVPAHQAVIRELLKTRQYAEAGERVFRLAAQLDPARPESPRTAEWLGRIVGAVVIAIGTPDAKSQFTYHDRLLRTSLPPVLLSNYEKGYGGVESELEQMNELIDAARSSSEAKRESDKAQIDADLKKDQNEIKLKQQDAQKTRQKWDEWITDQTAKADDILREQEKRFQDLENAVTAQIQSVSALRLALERLDRDALALQQLATGGQGVRRNIGVSTPNRDSVQLQLALEERRLAQLYDQQAGVSRQAAQTLAGRRNAIAEYQRATGVALKEATNLDRWEKRNKAVSENMKKAAEKKPAQVATLEARIKSLNTWDPSDFETEKRRLLADLGVVTADKTTDK